MGVAHLVENVHEHICKYALLLALAYARDSGTYSQYMQANENESHITCNLCLKLKINTDTSKDIMSIGSGQFFYWHKGDEYVCQWTNCHSKT